MTANKLLLIHDVRTPKVKILKISELYFVLCSHLSQWCCRSEVDDPDYFEMEIDFYFPRVISTGNYKAEGLIGNFPVQGKGIFNVTACK